LSTGVIFKGFMLQFVGNIYITPTHLPESAIWFSKFFIFGGLHISVFVMIGVLIVTHCIMRFTLTGRSIYALGGDATAAGRVGINIKRLNVFIYVFAGVLAEIAGTIYVANSRLADPYDLTGEELSIIAPVVLGGVGIMGGKGGVFGVALGVLLTKRLQNNLTLMGVSSDWHLLVFGAVFVIAMTAQAYKDRKFVRRAV